jgi:general secretion pathway protein D
VEKQLEIQREMRERKEAAVLGTFIGVDKSAEPWGDDTLTSIKYGDPKRWEELTISRERRFKDIENSIRSPKEMEIERKLYEPITINFTETPLGDVVEFFQQFTGVNVFLDKAALAADGISSDRPITMKLVQIPFKSALKLILGQMDLEYTVENDVLVITTPLKRQGKTYLKSYTVADLVVPITPFQSHNIGGGNLNNGGSIGIGPGMPGMPPSGMPMHNASLAQIGTGLGGSPPLTSGTGSYPGPNGNPPGMSGTLPSGMSGGGQAVDFDSLIELIEQTISPNSWSSVGGAGTIEPFQPNLSLVVNQTQAVHEQISDLLQQLRRLQDLQVTVEVKFLTLTEDFYERVGIDFDIDIQSDAQKPLRSFGQVITPAANAGAGGGGGLQMQTPAQLNLIYNDHDDDVAVGVGGSRGPNGLASTGLPVFTPDLKIPFRTGGFAAGRPQGFTPGDGLSFGMAFLSDIEVFLFLEAAQQNNRGNVLTAPKVTLFNGQFAFVFSGSVEPFITALNPVVAAGAVAFDPQITQFFNGAFLGVQAVISADRRYVRLSLFPTFNNISGEKRFTVTGGAGGGGGFGGGGAGGGGAANAQAEIVVPILSINTVITTVSVPDGGTVLLGGLKSKSEIRNESGVPILSKIPYVQRLYMNTGVSSITRSLLLMVTPRIIIQEEEEELLGKTIAY